MIDREKVIKGLEEVDTYFHRMTEVCYRGDEATFCDLKEKVSDALELLKEREETIDKLEYDLAVTKDMLNVTKYLFNRYFVDHERIREMSGKRYDR